MAKKREKPAVNPLRRDLVADLSRPPPSTPAPALHPQEAAVATVASPPIPATEPAPAPPPGKRKAAKESLGPKVRAGGERKVAVQRTRFNPAEIEDNAAFTSFLGELVRSKVTESDITRALWSLVRRSEDELRALQNRAPHLVRPAYADRLGSAAYEDAIAALLHRALKMASVEE